MGRNWTRQDVLGVVSPARSQAQATTPTEGNHKSVTHVIILFNIMEPKVLGNVHIYTREPTT